MASTAERSCARSSRGAKKRTQQTPPRVSIPSPSSLVLLLSLSKGPSCPRPCIRALHAATQVAGILLLVPSEPQPARMRAAARRPLSAGRPASPGPVARTERRPKQLAAPSPSIFG
ncbi:hypothetical protein FA09DRAFT_20461 [Tilletiopsis washingtonensis]|uniref:Uncharacterized protein n=1 Tax=Tilletiopsis washingtonensis TaxID=58919 RepID=A0A316ZD52_9BASI|nr:hypothetical protein FA09DRAFT_20461 [Tilletiopsis washingtonensis]PWN98183.1 hypothetical protein FA09DRAFT_20461 [Tilletiopsis washingtonensis]